jgi:hypothetical protein
MTYFDTDQNMIKVDSLKEWPKLVIHLDDTLFKIDSSRHVSLYNNLILDFGSDLELVHVTRPGRVAIENSKNVDVVPIRVFGKFGNLSSAQLWQLTHIKTEKVEQSIINGMSGDCCQLLLSSLRALRSLPRV